MRKLRPRQRATQAGSYGDLVSPWAPGLGYRVSPHPLGPLFLFLGNLLRTLPFGQMLTFIMLARLAALCPVPVLQRVDRLIEPLRATCTAKVSPFPSPSLDHLVGHLQTIQFPVTEGAIVHPSPSPSQELPVLTISHAEGQRLRGQVVGQDDTTKKSQSQTPRPLSETLSQKGILKGAGDEALW